MLYWPHAMKREAPLKSAETGAQAAAKVERGGIMKRIAEVGRRVSPALGFLIAMNSLGAQAHHGKKNIERDGDTLVAHIESAGGGDVETREIPPHTVDVHADVHYEWGERSFGHVEMEAGERAALEAQLGGVIDYELAAYQAEGVNPSDVINNIHVDIEAFSDPTGGRANPERNMELSEGRAELASEVMRDILHTRGFDDAHVDITAHGGGTEGDLMEFSGALASHGFRSHAGSPDSMRNEAERIVHAINDGNESEVLRLTHGMSSEAVHQAYADTVASHRHANVDITMETAGIRVTHDAGNPPPVLEAVKAVRAQDTYRLDIKQPVYLNEERYAQPRFWQTSGQLREPEPTRPREYMGTGLQQGEVPPQDELARMETMATPQARSTDARRERVPVSRRTGVETAEEPELIVEALPSRERRALEAMARQAERRGEMIVDTTMTTAEKRAQEAARGAREDRGRRERQAGSIKMKVLRSVGYKPVKTARYRGFAGSPGSLAG